MVKSKALVSLVLGVFVLFAVFDFIGSESIAFALNSLIIPIIAVIYFVFFEKKTLLFSLFLICYSVSELIGLIVNFIPITETSLVVFDLDYYIGNALYIMAYVFLFIKICKGLNILKILKNFKIHLIVLVVLNVWLVYVLQDIINQQVSSVSEYYFELTYNIVMLVLLSGALLNYFYRDNQKTLYLFLGVLCIVFSEVIDVAYLYISQRALLNFLATSLTLSAFYFFCKQVNMSDVKEHEIHMYPDTTSSKA